MASERAALTPVLAILAAAVLWGLWWIPVRALAASGFAGDWVSLAVYGLVTAVMLPVAVLRRARFVAGGLPLLVIGLCLGFALTAWNHAVLTGEVVRAILLFYLCPIWATGFAWLILRQRMGGLRFIAIGLGLTGAVVVLGGLEGGAPLPRAAGEWMALASGAAFALAATLTRKGDHGGEFEKTFAAFVAAAVTAIVFIAVAPVGAAPSATALWPALPLLIGVAALWLLPQTWLVVWGAARLDPGRVSLLLLIEIVVTAVSATLLTDEPFGGREFAGCVLILGAGAVEAFAQIRGPSR